MSIQPTICDGDALSMTSLHPPLSLFKKQKFKQLQLSDHQLATVLSAQMTKHIFRSRESIMVVQLNTPQKPSDPGPKASACCMFLILLF